MTRPVRYPSLYQINTRVWLNRLSRQLERQMTLATVPDDELKRIADLGFDWVWLLSVWQTGEAGRTVARQYAPWQEAFRRALPDLTDHDICGSGFAITDYEVSPALGGHEALASLRQRLRSLGIKLMLDFVPNHVALDHHWIQSHPDYFVSGSEDDLRHAPQNYTRIASDGGPLILAHGRDPYFPGWPDTLQLNYGNPALQWACLKQLLNVAGQCDGLRCDMAMLILPEVFKRTWGIDMEPFWLPAINRVRDAHPGFTFMAEVYWDMEWTLQQQGFDYCYDKRLYDRLRQGHAPPVRAHLAAGIDYQRKLARFLENHDEPRAAAVFPRPMHKAAAVITYFTPGLRFFYQGQLEGFRVQVPPHLCRGPDETADKELEAFYGRLLSVMNEDLVRNGTWSQINPSPAWAGNNSHDNFIACTWHNGGKRLLTVINFHDGDGQCRLRLPFTDMAGSKIRLRDEMGDEVYVRDGDALLDPGLYIARGPWGFNVFDLTFT